MRALSSAGRKGILIKEEHRAVRNERPCIKRVNAFSCIFLPSFLSSFLRPRLKVQKFLDFYLIYFPFNSITRETERAA